MKSGNLKFLEPSGPFQTCNGTALPFYILYVYIYTHTHIDLHVKKFIFLSDFTDFLDRGLKNLQISNIKIFPVGDELFQADGQTNVTKLKSLCERA